MATRNTEIALESAARQRLIGPRDESPLAVYGATIGVYGSAPAFEFSTIARSSNPPSQIGELVEAREVVRLRCMRGSVYAVPTAFFPTVFTATRELVRKGHGRSMKWAKIEESEKNRLARRLPKALAGVHHAGRSDLRELLGPMSDEAAKNMSILAGIWCSEGILVRTGSRNQWRGDKVSYALVSEWLPEVDLNEIDVDTARADLAAMYLKAFGPATINDFYWWSGLSKKDARVAVISAIGHEPADDEMLRVDDPPQTGEGTEPLRLLPPWDTYFVAYKDRSRQAADKHLPWLYDNSGNATSVVLHNGVADGIWQLHKDDPVTVNVAWLPGVKPPALKLVRAEAKRLTELLALNTPTVTVVDLPPPLGQRARNAHLAPLPRAD